MFLNQYILNLLSFLSIEKKIVSIDYQIINVQEYKKKERATKLPSMKIWVEAHQT